MNEDASGRPPRGWATTHSWWILLAAVAAVYLWWLAHAMNPGPQAPWQARGPARACETSLYRQKSEIRWCVLTSGEYLLGCLK